VKAAVIVNPISGTGGRPAIARQRAELAARLLEEQRVEPEVFVTERPGHARDLTHAAIGRGIRCVLAWGGDGTVNEVASVLAFTDATLAIIPSGSGNGLARELGIPLEPKQAFAMALSRGVDRIIDAGELDGRLFFNVAGIGLDAHVAHRFAEDGLVRRGFLRYLEVTTQQLFAYDPDEHTVTVNGEPQRVRALLIAIANGRQYGNGAIIAPHARLDDGCLDVVCVAQRSLLSTVASIPKVFAGTIDRVQGVSMRRGTEIEITSARPVIYHVDGEPFIGGASVRARVHASALRVRVSEM